MFVSGRDFFRNHVSHLPAEEKKKSKNSRIFKAPEIANRSASDKKEKAERQKKINPVVAFALPTYATPKALARREFRRRNTGRRSRVGPVSFREPAPSIKMLPRKNRLTKFFRSNKTVSESGIKIFFTSNDLDFSRFGVSIQSGVLKKAVWRNRCKRLIREFLRKNLAAFEPGLDVWILIQAVKPELRLKREKLLLEAVFWNKSLACIFEKSGIYSLSAR